MVVYGIVVLIIYLGLLIYILPAEGMTFDLYERKFRLLPYWFKIIAICWLIISLVLILVFQGSIAKWGELLLSNFNISLFIFFFSKQKNEDEFSEQIRFKAFTYSFVTLVGMIVAIGAITMTDEESIWSNFLVQGYFGGGLLIATLYFYFTVYKLRKENS